MTAPTETVTPPGSAVEAGDETNGEIPVRFPVVVIENLDTSDGRFLEAGSLTARALPLSILAQPASAHGGDQPGPAQVVGRVDTLIRTPGPEVTSRRTGKHFPDGTFVWSGTGAIDANGPIADLVRKQYLRGVSVDLTGMDFDVVGEAGFTGDPSNPKRQIFTHSAEIAAITLCPVPAFADAYCELADETGPPDPVVPEDLPVGLAASAAPAWRSEEVGDTGAFIGHTESGNVSTKTREAATMTAAVEAATRRPPISWFTDPQLEGETPITVDNGGHVYGHIAVWSRSHIGYGGRPIYAQPSKTDYAMFNTGAVRCVDEDGTTRIAAVGHLTVDAPHADLHLNAVAAGLHYAHSAYAWADVAAGDDRYGVWVNGIVKLGVPEEKIDFALAHPPSGDWRPIDGHLELVAALCVNTPGIPVLRARVASGEIVALVAAGAIAAAPRGARATVLDYDTLADVLADRLDRRSQDRELSAAHTALVAELDDTPTVVASLLSAVDDTPQRIAELLADLDGIDTFDVGRMPPQLRESYLHGKAAAKIIWGSPGDFRRCELEAAHHGIPERMRPGMCAELHKEATGAVPGQAPGERIKR